MKKIRPIILLGALGLGTIIPCYAHTTPDPITQQVPNFSQVLTRVMPAVVNVTVINEAYVTTPVAQNVPQMPDTHGKRAPANPNQASPRRSVPMLKRFAEMGSGVIIRSDQHNTYIVTNAHVVHGAKRITVALSDGRRFKAKLVGEDRLSDIAVIKIAAHTVQTLDFADSDQLKIGVPVAAIGNPFGLRQTVTSGMVSALHRSDLGIEGYENFIQTDASINPGNSGGALIDLRGNLVGINTALIGPIGGNVGIGLAIPSNMVKKVSDQLIAHGKVNRGVLGIYVQDLTPALADAFNMSGKKGALVTKVMAGSPAAKAGIKVQDVIDNANGTVITSGPQLRNFMGLLPEGTHVKLHALRKNKAFFINTQVASPKKLKKSVETPITAFLEGVRLTSYDELVPNFGPVKGVGVLRVDEASNAWIGGLRAGDIILAANNKTVSNLDALLHLVQIEKKQLLLKVGRHSGVIFLVINQ